MALNIKLIEIKNKSLYRDYIVSKIDKVLV